MKLLKIFGQSIKALSHNKGRSFLTVLGIIIGIGSVIALISLGNGVQKNISGRINALGATTLTVMPGAGLNLGGGNSGQSRPSSGEGSRGGGGFSGSQSSTLTTADLSSLRDKTKNPKIKEVSGNISASSIFNVASGQQRFSVTGVDPEYFNIEELLIGKGALFTKADVAKTGKFVVLGNSAAANLFQSSNPIGKSLTIQNDSYVVVGVLQSKSESGFTNPNNQIYAPESSLSATFATANFSSFTVKVDSEADVDLAKAAIEKTILKNHGITDPKLADFSVLSPKDLLSAVDQITNILTTFLAGIAAISLLVGGIGIMNIMLVSVTERTREIGLRKAVGAKTFDILLQFIFESVLLTLIGGIFGIGLGILIGRIAARFLGFEPVLTSFAILLAVGVSSAVGIIFGIYPAIKAARLSPIDALRYE